MKSMSAEYRNSDIGVKRLTDHVYRDTDLMDNIPRTPFGKRLFDSREAKGLTQDDAAKRAGMKSQSTLAEAEIYGKRSGFTSQLAEIYGVDPKWLATGDGAKGARSNAAAAAAPALPRPCAAVLDDLATLLPEDAEVWCVRIRAAAVKVRRLTAAPPSTSKDRRSA